MRYVNRDLEADNAMAAYLSHARGKINVHTSVTNNLLLTVHRYAMTKTTH